jgi:RimJ/RimL family protein N-acetyltransferase
MDAKICYSFLSELKRAGLELSGPGICLRLIKFEDLPTTLAWRNREDIRHNFINSDIISWEGHSKWWEGYRVKNNDFIFLILETERLSRSVGQVSLYNINLDHSEAEYGRLMIGDNEARGKGLARRATELLIAWAFNSLGIERIYLEVFKNNTIALNLYRQFGFITTGDRGRLYRMSISRETRPSSFEGIKQEDSIR